MATRNVGQGFGWGEDRTFSSELLSVVRTCHRERTELGTKETEMSCNRYQSWRSDARMQGGEIRHSR